MSKQKTHKQNLVGFSEIRLWPFYGVFSGLVFLAWPLFGLAPSILLMSVPAVMLALEAERKNWLYKSAAGLVWKNIYAHGTVGEMTEYLENQNPLHIKPRHPKAAKTTQQNKNDPRLQEPVLDLSSTLLAR